MKITCEPFSIPGHPGQWWATIDTDTLEGEVFFSGAPGGPVFRPRFRWDRWGKPELYLAGGHSNAHRLGFALAEHYIMQTDGWREFERHRSSARLDAQLEAMALQAASEMEFPENQP